MMLYFIIDYFTVSYTDEDDYTRLDLLLYQDEKSNLKFQPPNSAPAARLSSTNIWLGKQSHVL